MISEQTRAQVDTQSDTQTTPIKVRKLGHMVYRVSDIERTTRFWTEIMGFKLSDRNEHGMVFLRNASDHHTIALAPVTESNPLPTKSQVGFDHLAMEVENVAALFKIRDFLRAKGVTITFEGRKGPGCNPGVEFMDPDGFTFELYASMDQIGWDDKSRPSDQWRRVSSLQDVVANPVQGVTYDV